MDMTAKPYIHWFQYIMQMDAKETHSEKFPESIFPNPQKSRFVYLFCIYLDDRIESENCRVAVVIDAFNEKMIDAGGEGMTEKTFPAKDTALKDVLSFAEEELRKAGCHGKAVMPITVALEEIFINVACYAYPHSSGEVSLGIDYDSESRTMTFQMTDSGIPFDPLSKPDPDITLPAEERNIGGLGIYMMKRTMDEVRYRYENGQNRLTMKKAL